RTRPSDLHTSETRPRVRTQPPVWRTKRWVAVTRVCRSRSEAVVRGKFLARFRRSVVPSIAWVATLALVASLLVAGTTPATAQQAPDPTPSVDPLAPSGPLPPNLAITQAANTGQPVLVGTDTPQPIQTCATPT